ncbi:hypothetical protein ABCR94_02115 [Streptomyces sp. 21So2-11]|uniref:hypothetical protein n=1 Tax=Streptomyces sp. 21So2-11 TaxID=3144408 RepID=UPI00321BD201
MFIAATQLAAAAHLLLRPLATTVAYTAGRSADESAADCTGDRERVVSTVGKATPAAQRARTRSRTPAAAPGP